MNSLNIIAIVFALITCVSIQCKIYYQMKVNKLKTSDSTFSNYFLLFSLTFLLPMKTDVEDKHEKRLRRNGNIALMIFYLTLISALVLSIIIN